MGRSERPLDPNGPVSALAAQLRSLRSSAGLTYRDMAGRAHYSPSMLATAASGSTLPTWELTRAFVIACGDDPGQWRDRWLQAFSNVHSEQAHASDEPPDDDPIQALAAQLRALRRTAGAPSYSDLSHKTGFARSTLHDALSGSRLPNLELVLSIVRALGGDQDTWRQRWHDARARIEVRAASSPDEDPTTHPSTIDGDPASRSNQTLSSVAARFNRRGARLLLLILITALVGAAGIVTAWWVSSPGIGSRPISQTTTLHPTHTPVWTEPLRLQAPTCTTAHHVSLTPPGVDTTDSAAFAYDCHGISPTPGTSLGLVLTGNATTPQQCRQALHTAPLTRTEPASTFHTGTIFCAHTIGYTARIQITSTGNGAPAPTLQINVTVWADA